MISIKIEVRDRKNPKNDTTYDMCNDSSRMCPFNFGQRVLLIIKISTLMPVECILCAE